MDILMVMLLVLVILAGPVLSAMLYWQRQVADRRTTRNTLLRQRATQYVWWDVSLNHFPYHMFKVIGGIRRAYYVPSVSQADGSIS